MQSNSDNLKLLDMIQNHGLQGTLSTVLSRVPEMAVGEYTGTGAALDVALNFDPKFVLVYNLTDGDTMGFAFNTTNVADTSAVVDAAVAAATASQGILFAAAGAHKFSLGTDAKLNESAKVYQYVAFGY